MIDKQFDQDLSAAMDKNGAFYAFNNQQLAEKKQDGVEYVNMGAGLIAPKDNAKQLITDMATAIEQHKQRTLAQHSKENIILYELRNHEAEYTYDIDDTVDAVEIYEITREEVQAMFGKYIDRCMDTTCFKEIAQ